MKDDQRDLWIPHTDGRKVWVVNARTGATRWYVDDQAAEIASVHCLGDEIGIVSVDGRTRAWNPRTDCSRTFL